MLKLIQIMVLMSCLMLPFLGHAAEPQMEQFVEQVWGVDTAQARVQIGDQSFTYTNFTIVQDYRSEPDQRLPLNAARRGTWVLVDAYYSVDLKRYIVQRLQLLPSTAVAKKLLEKLNDE